MTTTIKATSVRAFELFAKDGSSMGLFTVADTWEGMCKLESVRDPQQSVIANAPSLIVELGLANSFAEYPVQLDVIKASPDLLVKVMK